MDYRSSRLDKRKREKVIHLAPYQNQFMKHYAGNLYDTEKVLEDAVESAAVACPQIAAHLRQTVAQEDDQMELGAEQGHVSVEFLCLRLLDIFTWRWTLKCIIGTCVPPIRSDTRLCASTFSIRS